MANDSCCLDSCCECKDDGYECDFDIGDDKSSINANALDALLEANAFFGGFIFTGLSYVSRGNQSLQGNRACDAGLDIDRNVVVFEVFSFICFLVSTLLALVLKLVITRINCTDVERTRRNLLACIPKLRARADIRTADIQACQVEKITLSAAMCTLRTLQAEMRTLRADIRKLHRDTYRLAITLQGKDRARIDKRWVHVGLLCSGFLTGLGCIFLVISMVFLSETLLGLLSCGSNATRETVVPLTIVALPAIGIYICFIYRWLCLRTH